MQEIKTKPLPGRELLGLLRNSCIVMWYATSLAGDVAVKRATIAIQHDPELNVPYQAG